MTPQPPPQREPLPAPGAWQWRVHTGDADQHAQAQPEWLQEYQQLSGGRFEGFIHHVQLPGLRLVREDSNQATRQRGNLGQGNYGLALAVRQDGPAIFNGQKVQGDALMVGRGDALDLVTPTNFSLIAVVVQGELLHPLWESMYGKQPSPWLQQQLVVPARPAAAAAVRALHLRAMDDLASATPALRQEGALLQLRDALLMEWIEALPEKVSSGELATVAARKRIVDDAVAMMLAHTGEPLSLLQVCRRVGASRRKLNYCFQDVLGASPVKYLRAVRLNGVRRELRAGAGSVQEAAARWGFWHLGQFARDYKAQFGELPSATRRASGPP